MNHHPRLLPLLSAMFFHAATSLTAAPSLQVDANFEGGSVAQVEIDQDARRISFTPGGDPARGWPCWWFFEIKGIQAGETLTLRLSGSSSNLPGATPAKPLSPKWAMPQRASISSDGSTWTHTDAGVAEGESMVYTIRPAGGSTFVAWGPPFTPSQAARLVEESVRGRAEAKAMQLCESRGGRSVPMLRVAEGPLEDSKRFGVWVQARQHAWEAGSSWVAAGFLQWLLGDSAEARWTRQHAEVFIVPVMDVDNAATGNGGKDAQPHDHNRDWSELPHWNETIAAKKRVEGLIAAGRMDVFLDLHNPSPDDPTFFYALDPNFLGETAARLSSEFISLAYARISQIKPLVPMSNRPKFTGPNYHPRWKEISANWVAANGNPHTVGLCLETIWNSPASTITGYKTVGSSLGAALREYLGRQPER